MDYTKNQASWTLLYKKKVTLSTGEEEILYDRLKKRIRGSRDHSTRLFLPMKFRFMEVNGMSKNARFEKVYS